MFRFDVEKARMGFGASLLTILVGLATAHAASPSAEGTPEGSTMATHASGSFDVTMTPQGPEDKAEGSTVGRNSIDKRFFGDLEATSRGQALMGVSDVQGSAGYVAMERVTGTLKGRRGSFLLQHSGTMSKSGGYQLSVTVVPDSGSGQLVGLSGKLDIKIVDGKHFYNFEYTLPESR
jgi:hypothetical protein